MGTVIIQNTRGKWGSEGKFSPFVDELTDGMATLDWIQSHDFVLRRNTQNIKANELLKRFLTFIS